jgi:vitamin B12 transporter
LSITPPLSLDGKAAQSKASQETCQENFNQSFRVERQRIIKGLCTGLPLFLSLFLKAHSNNIFKNTMRKFNKLFKIQLAFLPVLLFVQANAQNDTTFIEEAVISATRLEDKPSETGRSISIIKAAEIKNSVYTNVAELLSKQEGIYVVGAGQTPGNTQTIFTRGSSSNHTLIMVDGIRIADPSAVNNSIDLSELSLVNVEKIEIIRGSHSTIYGSSAIGGVVNIITRKNQKPGLNVYAEEKVGTWGNSSSLFQENLFLNYTSPTGFYANASIINLNVNGLNATVDTMNNYPDIYHTHDKDNFHKLDAIGKIGYHAGKLDVFGSYKRTNQKNDVDAAAFKDDDNSMIKFNRDFFNYGASYKFSENLNLVYNGGLSFMKRNLVNDSSAVDNLGSSDKTYSDNQFDGTTIQNEIQVNYVMKGLKATIGGGHYDDRMNTRTYFYSNAFGPPAYISVSDLDTLNLKSSIKNIFGHVTLNGVLVNEKFSDFSLGLGSRLNNHTIFGNHITYELNPSYKIGKNSLIYFSYSTGFNAPSLYQLYAPDNYYTSTVTRGNKNLKPEISKTYEIGMKQSIGENTFITASYFQTTVKNTIEYVLLWDKNIGVDTLGNNFLRDDYRGDSYFNAGTQTNKGVELNINSKLSGKFSFIGNISIVNSSIKYKPTDIDTSESHGNHVQLNSNGGFITSGSIENDGLIRRPSSMVNLSLIYYPCKSVFVRLDSRMVAARTDVFYDSNLGPYGALGRVPVSEYVVVDLSANYNITQGLTASFRMENIFNKKYSEIKGYATRPRGVFLKLAYTFNYNK